LLAIQIERRGVNKSVGKQLLYLSILRIREGNQCFFCAPEIKRRVVSPHRLFEALHIAVNVAIQQFEEKAEVLWIALVRRRRRQEQVVGHSGDRSPQW